MGIGQIIAIIIAIPTFILIIIPMVISFWAEGQVTDALMEVFGFNPVIAGLITILGAIVFIIAIIKVASSTF